MSLFLAAGVFALEARRHSPQPNRSPEPANGFAVVELFTSEGCSSCPPADQAVARIQRETRGQPVYILAFHVDYWNRLGWKDVFSDAAYSERQNRYAQWLHLKSVYTPQVVVNGRLEFVGSEEDRLRSAIRENLQMPAPAQLTLENVQTGGREISLGYHTDGAGNSSSLLIALVQKSATTEVKRGENAGATLSHVQIVRGFLTIALSGKNGGEARLSLPEGLTGKQMEIIGFLQNNATGEILAAYRVGLG
jgi:hypothetical protein